MTYPEENMITNWNEHNDHAGDHVHTVLMTDHVHTVLMTCRQLDILVTALDMLADAEGLPAEVTPEITTLKEVFANNLDSEDDEFVSDPDAPAQAGPAKTYAVECYWCGRDRTGDAEDVLTWGRKHACSQSKRATGRPRHTIMIK